MDARILNVVGLAARPSSIFDTIPRKAAGGVGNQRTVNLFEEQEF
jgi:hypothetical protein